ncbi:MAG: hypothetical protein ACRD2R_01445, partial [Terriglobales bacterium]
MRLDINLASHPYEDVRRFLWFWGPPAAAVLVFSVLLAGSNLRNWMAAAPVRQKVEAERQAIARLEAERSRELGVLNRPEHRDLRLKAAFVNGLIARKAFS